MTYSKLLFCFITTTLFIRGATGQEQSLSELFPRDRVLEVEITVDEEDWDEIRNQSRDFAEALQPSRQFGSVDSPYTYVKATVTIDGVEYPGIGLRKKGFIGSQDNQRPSLKIKLNRSDKTANIGGLKNLTFNNNKQDRSLMSQFMGYEIFNAAGSPAPRTAYAKVTVNGKNLGVYSHVETIREPLLKRAYGDDSGTLFEGTVVDFYPEWEQSFERKIGDENIGRQMIKKLTDALQSEDIDLQEIWSLVDEESFYRFWTVEGLLSFWDGYSGNRNNFFIYLDPTSGKLHFIPWGADCMFEKYSQLGEDRRSPRAVRMQGLLANRLYQIPEVRAKYARIMRELLAQEFNEEKLLAETNRIEVMLEPHMSNTQRRNIDFDGIRSFIKNRRADIEGEVNGPDMPLWSHEPEEPPVIGQVDWKKNNLANAAKEGDLRAIQKHIDAGEDINSVSKGTGSVLNAAAMTDQVEAIRLLVKNGADVNIANADGNTPLHGAAFFGNVDSVQALLDARANPNPRNNDGGTPLDSSASPWSDEFKGIVEFIANLVNIDVDMKKVKAGRPKVVSVLRKSGGKFGRELPPPEGAEIGLAAKMGDMNTLRTLIEDGADPNQRDRMAITPLCWAAMSGHADAAELLIKSGAKVNGRNGDGGTPLHGAAFLGKTKLVAILLENGADAQARNDEGRTALDTIAGGWNPEMKGVVVWVAGFLELDIEPRKVGAAWPEITRMLRNDPAR